MHLRGTGTFRPVSPVVFVELAEGISELRAARAARCARGPLHARPRTSPTTRTSPSPTTSDDALDRAFERARRLRVHVRGRGVPPLRARRRRGMARRRRLRLRRRAGRGAAYADEHPRRRQAAARAACRPPGRGGRGRATATCAATSSPGHQLLLFFSIFPAVALAFTVFGFVLQNRPDLLQAVADGVAAVPPRASSRTPSTRTGSSRSRRRAPARSPSPVWCPRRTGAGRPGLDRRDARRHPRRSSGWRGARQHGDHQAARPRRPGDHRPGDRRLGHPHQHHRRRRGWVADHVGLGGNGWVVTAGRPAGRRRGRHRPDARCCCGSSPGCRCRPATWCRARCSAGWGSPS